MPEFEVYKVQLEAALSRVGEELCGIAILDKKTGDWIAVPVSDDMGNADQNVEADVVEEWNERMALMDQLETQYRNIVRALKKMEDGVYGKCEISGDPIEIERLSVNPAARTNLANIDRERELPL